MKYTKKIAHNPIVKHSRYILLGVSLYFLLATLFVTFYKFDDSLSVCACQATGYKSSSFMLKALLYKEKVYAITEFGCGGVNACIPNTHIFPTDLLTLSGAFFLLFVLITYGKHQSKKKQTEHKKITKHKPKPKKKGK